MKSSENKKKSLSFSELKRLEHIKELIKREYKHQCELAYDLDIEPQNLSRCLRSGKISDKMCRKIKELFPTYSLEWLLGYDEYMTENEKSMAQDISIRLNAPLTVLDTALKEACLAKGVEVPEVGLSDCLFLKAQLEDYAFSLMWHYINHENSRVWNFLTQQEQRLLAR